MKDKLKAAIGAVVKELRESRGLTQVDLAGACGVDQSTIAHTEAGDHMPRNETWARITPVLRVGLDEIMTLAHERMGKHQNGRRVAALDEHEYELLAAYQRLTAEGRRLLLKQADACLTLHAKKP